jgi:hypothetical protein
MPLIPGINEQDVKAAPANSPYFKVQATADQFGNNIGKSMLAVGTSFGAASENYHKAQEERLAAEKAAKASDAQDGVNRYDVNVQGIQRGVLTLKGKDAVLAQSAALRDIDAQQAEIVAKAPTPEAAQKIRAATDVWGALARDTIQRHALAQQRVYADDVDNQQVDLGRSAVGLLYNDTSTFLTRLHVAATTRADQAVRQLTTQRPDASPQEIMAVQGSARQQTASDFVRARIEGALDQKDVAAAQALYKRWGADLLPGDQAAVGAQMTATQFLSQANQETNRVLQQSASEQPIERR